MERLIKSAIKVITPYGAGTATRMLIDELKNFYVEIVLDTIKEIKILPKREIIFGDGIAELALPTMQLEENY